MPPPASTIASPVPLPRLAVPTRVQSLQWAAGLAVACGLWLARVPLAFLAGLAAADLASGLLHWAADTWGRSDLPWIGPRVLVPFRVHHVNPDDFLRRTFLDTNGDIAALTAVVLLALHAVPLDTTWGPVLVIAGAAFTGLGLWTNQIHQWAHQPDPPLVVRQLQAFGLILRRDAHDRHHRHPHAGDYCITTGWCNGVLGRLDLFRRMERIVTRLTGAVPRQDEAHWFDAPGAR